MARIKAPRPRLRGARSKPAPISFTDLQRKAHEQSTASRYVKTVGAFGGVTRKLRDKREAALKAATTLTP